MTRATNRTIVGLCEFAEFPLAMVIPEMIRFDPPVLVIVRFVVRGLRHIFCRNSLRHPEIQTREKSEDKAQIPQTRSLDG